MEYNLFSHITHWAQKKHLKFKRLLCLYFIMFLYKYICEIMFLSLGKVTSKENHHLLKDKSWTVLSEIAMGFFE